MMFAPDIEVAIERFAREQGLTQDEALAALVRDWLVGHGYLDAEDQSEQAIEGGANFVGGA